MLGKFKEAVNKKGIKAPNLAGSVLAPVGPGPAPTPAGTPRKSPRKKREKTRKTTEKPKTVQKKKKSVEQPDGSTTEEEEGSRSNEDRSDGPTELLGQVYSKKADPKGFQYRILRTERPDLFTKTSEELTGEAAKLLDDYLTRKGQLSDGAFLTLGRVVDSESKVEVGKGDGVEVSCLFAHGRFGAVYLAYKQCDGGKTSSTQYALKISRRMLASARIQHEIAVLDHLYTKNRTGKWKKVPYPTHIIPVFFTGTAGGTTYFMMPMLDGSVERVRQDIGHRFPSADVFFIGQESIVAIRECHAHSIVHRDIKPTNFLLGVQNTKSWWLCDFGEASPIGNKRILSPPDALTLPFLARESHRAVMELVPSSTRMDIESWFYMVLDLFVPLPWHSLTEESEVLTAKNVFWSSLDSFFQSAGAQTPPQCAALAQIVAGPIDEHVYGRLTSVLRDGFQKNVESPPWRPSWADKRKRAQLPAPKEATATKPPKKGIIMAMVEQKVSRKKNRKKK
ncbi:unnamed protein product [Caenorhabditis sp. 36 PRJEB53466]|nr:unnamed protein product [Caenorhabditis sp. 36 PRJEB53466]